MTHKIFIDGAAGTTGLEIRDRLAARPELELIELADAQRKDLVARRDALNAADVVILCLPDDAAREAVALIESPHTRVIDASTAHRTAPDWTYGFPELVGHKAVANARFVSNPGCYATGFIALIAPLVRAGLIATDAALSCNAVSGYSGGGNAMIAEFEAVGHGTPNAQQLYALNLSHKHVPEMQAHAGLKQPPLFTPAVVNIYRGMLVSVPLMLAGGVNDLNLREIGAALQAAYQHSPIINVITDFADAILPITYAANTDKLDLFVFGNAERQHVSLLAALDNLGKGAAGAAVQNLNIMLGLDEVTGLRL